MRVLDRVLILLLLAVPGWPQTGAPSAAPASGSPTIRTTTREVLLDLVVRDKKERLVADLRPDDVEVFEDGVKQKIKVFRLISGKEQTDSDVATEAREAGAASHSGALAHPRNPLREINLVSIVFHSMSPRSRLYAKDAALQFLKNELLSNTYVAVFSMDYHLNALVNYTQDVSVLRKAIERAATGAYSQFSLDSANVLTQVNTELSGGRGGIQSTPSFDVFTSPGMAMAGAEQGSGEGSRAMASILRGQLLAGSYQFGMRSMMALLSMVRAQAQLPGRKTVLYLSEGLPVAPGRPELLRTAIAEANRAQVSFYAIDVRGLTLQNPASVSASELRNLAAMSQMQSDSRPMRPDQFKQDDYLLYGLTANTQQNMQELAEDTGGFLIANTNDLAKPMRHIMEDVRTHYELTYTPASENYDGRFRKIEVRLARAGLKLQSRNGYFALPDLNGDPLLPYEMAALKALNASPPPKGLAYRAGALQFHPLAGVTQCALAFDLPIGELTSQVDAQRQTARLHATFLALIKDEHGQVIGKISRDLPQDVPADKLQEFRQGHMIFTQAFGVRPGRYTLETAVLDPEGSKAAAKRSVFIVPAVHGVGLSSITLVRRIDPLTEPRDPGNPMQLPGQQITPSLADAVRAGADALYFVVYPDAARSPAQPELTLQFFTEGKEIARQSPALPAADESGAIPVVLAANLNPGQYEVRVTVKQGDSVIQQATAFSLE